MTKGTTFKFRWTSEEAVRYAAAAKAQGISLAAWMREAAARLAADDGLLILDLSSSGYLSWRWKQPSEITITMQQDLSAPLDQMVSDIEEALSGKPHTAETEAGVIRRPEEKK